MGRSLQSVSQEIPQRSRLQRIVEIDRLFQTLAAKYLVNPITARTRTANGAK